MDRGTPEDPLVDAFERQLRGEKRVFLHDAPRNLERLKKLADWQILQLAEALSIPEAIEHVRHRSFEKLARADREMYLHLELESYDKQHCAHEKKISDPAFWSELMQQYLKKELTLACQ